VDDIAVLLDRAVTSEVSSVPLPPVSTIEAASRRRDRRRSLVSLTVVLVLAIGSVLGLASTGHASETGPAQTSATGAIAASHADAGGR
jgi:hypothetical protein